MSEISGKRINPYIFDMRGFLQTLEIEGDLVRIRKEVEGGDEIASVMWELEERKGNHAPAIVFDKIKGFEIPVVKNLFGSLRRWALVLGFPDDKNPGAEELSVSANGSGKGMDEPRDYRERSLPGSGYPGSTGFHPIPDLPLAPN
jgi:3-polyprenyl-4-hydroxybenzoate decarboxylase